MKFAFIGLGNMGMPLAENILNAREDLLIYSSKPATREKFARLGAKIASDKASLANCEILCSCLPLPKDVITLADELYDKMPKGAIHLEFSTIDPETANGLAQKAKSLGLGYVQATVSKTPAVASKGEAPFFVGGEKWAVEKVMPILDKIGNPENVETITAACAIKLLSNLIGMSNIALVAEGMKIGALAHMDANRLLNLLLDTGAASFQMKTRGPWIAQDDYEARFSIRLAIKDMTLGCAMAKKLGLEPAMMTRTLALLEQADKAGLGEEDVCALYKIM